MLAHIRDICARDRTAIFFAEDRSDWLHIGPLADHVVRLGRPVLRLTADPNDPLIVDRGAMFIGRMVAGARLFLGIPSSVVVMTMTDLGTYHLKRSVHDVHYVYVFHSLLSTHRAYRAHAFDAYDSILCSGPHHKRELAAAGGVRPIRPRDLLEAGYCRLDEIITESGTATELDKRGVRALVAPTWGPSSLIEHNLEKIVKDLLDHPAEVILRFHPMSLRHQPDLEERYIHLFGNNPQFSLDQAFESTSSFLTCDVVISDWSGAAHEFSLGLLRPTIFVDTPQKANNDIFHTLNIECYEDTVREDLGALVPLSDTGSIPDLVTSLHDDREVWRQRLTSIRDENVYNPGSAVSVSAEHIVQLLS